MLAKRVKKRRPGAALVEAVITMMAYLSLMLGMIDMGIATFQMHIVSQAASQGTRKACCQGALAPANLNGGPWGPASFSGKATSTNAIVTTILGCLTGLDLSQVTVNATWPDGNNKVGSRVTYQVSTTWTPMITWILGSKTYTLSGSSTMLIAH